MKPDPEKLRALLDDVLPASSEDCGPSHEELRSMLRSERRRRRQRHTGAGLLVLFGTVAGALHFHHKPSAVAPVVHTPDLPAHVVMRRVNDEELLAVLEGMPAALIKLPNGDSALLVIERPSVAAR